MKRCRVAPRYVRTDWSDQAVYRPWVIFRRAFDRVTAQVAAFGEAYHQMWKDVDR